MVDVKAAVSMKLLWRQAGPVSFRNISYAARDGKSTSLLEIICDATNAVLHREDRATCHEFEAIPAAMPLVLSHSPVARE